MVRDHFFHLTDLLFQRLQPGETLLTSFEGESSDFVRFNHARIRQAGHVEQAFINLHLIEGARHSQARCTLQGSIDRDLATLSALLQELRALRRLLPDDPHLGYAETPLMLERAATGSIPSSTDAAAEVVAAAHGLDMVGLWSGGTLYRGFSSSLGARCWYSAERFNLDWSCFVQNDKGVKADYAGAVWDSCELHRRMDGVRRQLDLLARPPVTLSPGVYRAYLAPEALRSIVDMMAWGGFGLKSQRTRQTPLLRMVDGDVRLHRRVNLMENNARRHAPGFTRDGYERPDRVVLVDHGALGEALVDARSAREFGEAVNCDTERPECLEMHGGDLPMDRVPATLEDGLLLNNFWYCNFSDRNSCRITGMTRFACFLVEGGEIAAPINVMRFDDSAYRILGEGLADITRERELILHSGTYDGRSTISYVLPGILTNGLVFTL